MDSRFNDLSVKGLSLIRVIITSLLSFLLLYNVTSFPISSIVTLIVALLSVKSPSYAMILSLIAFEVIALLHDAAYAVPIMPFLLMVAAQCLNSWLIGISYEFTLLSIIDAKFMLLAPPLIVLTSSLLPIKEALLFSTFTFFSSYCLLALKGMKWSVMMIVPSAMPVLTDTLSVDIALMSVYGLFNSSLPIISYLIRTFLADPIMPVQLSLYLVLSYVATFLNRKLKPRLNLMYSLLASTATPLLLFYLAHAYISMNYQFPLSFLNYLLSFTSSIASCYALSQFMLLSDRALYAAQAINAYERSSKTLSLDDVGDMDWVKEELYESIVLPLANVKLMKYYNIKPVKGILLFGPPGCGKTFIMRALASSLKVNFLYVRFSDLLSKWYGESERRIAEIFERARSMVPCIIFLDEIDALGRSRDLYSSDDVAPRILSVLLNEMDGLDPINGVIVVAATNAPHMLDPALLRPGRFDKLIYVPPPDERARKEILKVHLRDMPLADDVDIAKLASLTENFSGADLAMLCQEVARRVALEAAKLGRYRKIRMRDFLSVLPYMKPSITPELIERYREFRGKFERAFSSLSEV
ncbi:MAG: AAA family ATPase [Thermoprotei archaeon]|nr:AAA family ATPase [Thermoprotei archaeon]